MSRHPYRGKAGEGVAQNATPPLQSGEDRALIRVELLRLAHRHDQTAEQVVERAQVLETYVFSEPAADKF